MPDPVSTPPVTPPPATPPVTTPPATPPVIPPATPPQKPAGVPDAFWNAQTGQVDHEAWGNDYRAIKSKANDPLQAGGQQPESPLMKLPENASKADITIAAGLDPKVVAETFVKDGKLTEEQYKAYEKIGYPRALVNAELQNESTVANFERSVNTMLVTQIFGGVTQYQNAWSWAEQNLPAAQIAEITAQLKSPDAIKRQAGITAIKTAQAQAMAGGRSNPLIDGQPGAVATVSTFSTRAEIVQAKADLRYRHDNAYKAEVDAKILATHKAKGNIENLPAR